MYFKFNQKKNFFENPCENQHNENDLLDNNFKWKTKLKQLSSIILSDFSNRKEEKETRILLTKQIIQQKGNVIDFLLQQRQKDILLKIDSIDL